MKKIIASQLRPGDVTRDRSVVKAVKVESTGAVIITWSNDYRATYSSRHEFEVRPAKAR